MMPAAKGVYPPEADERRLSVMRSYTTPATQIDTDYMPDVWALSLGEVRTVLSDRTHSHTCLPLARSP